MASGSTRADDQLRHVLFWRSPLFQYNILQEPPQFLGIYPVGGHVARQLLQWSIQHITKGVVPCIQE